MSTSHWHKLYTAAVDAPATTLFKLISDLPNYGTWLSGSSAYGETTSVEPYPVRVGSRYHDGKPDGDGNSWWGTVTGLQPPGSIDFHHTIDVKQLRTTIDVNIHYSFEPEGDSDARTRVSRWLVLDLSMPALVRPLRPLITRSFNKENERTIAALKKYAEAQAARGVQTSP